MKKNIFGFLIFLISQMGFSNNLLWQGYFSYNEIKDVSVSTTTIFAASENALFSKNTTDNQIKLPILLTGFQARQSVPFTTVPF
jgi:hypothetical protein